MHDSAAITHEPFMRLALDEARKALKEGQLPVGAVLASDGKVLSIAHKSDNDYHLGHAEINVINQVFSKQQHNKRSDITIYTTLEPCVMCIGTILHLPIRLIVYSLEDPYGGATSLANGALPFRHGQRVPHVIGGVLRADMKSLMRSFLSGTDSPVWSDQANPLNRLVMT